ncbi:hypothetical protein NDU88_000604 [Pleurodeles waltl]|uniref:Uncharacterized protein n=1 Tax=Pleurodeles waltl TaxID=8319 RepID=A0AAV7VWL0_PLEWA|nr:hypothetical protein NDU88_000604 [Pleurodeles waltl]
MRRFPPHGQSLSVDRGDYQMTGAVRGFSCLFSGCASFRGTVRRNFALTAGVVSISPWKSGGVVLSRLCVEVPAVRKVSLRSASVCGIFLAAEQAVR